LIYKYDAFILHCPQIFEPLKIQNHMKLLALFLLVVSTYGVSAQKQWARVGKGGGGGGTKCSTPSGLSTSNITISSATANWSPVSGANSYNVDYKQSSSSSWINIASGTTSLSWNLSGLPASTSFDWRVRTNCSSGSSGYAQKTFSTLSQGGSCSAPTGLSTSGITISSATANWSAVSGANSYDVDYKQSSSGSWINIASGTTSLSWNLLGMPASTSFDWRVRANCSSGSSGYAQTTFSTLSQSGSCSAPTDLLTSPITATSATAKWAPVSGATSYNVDYKLASSPDWVTIANGTTSLQWTLSGLQATTSYDWRVRANCTSGNSSYTQTQFTTQAIGSCSAPGGLSTSNIASSTATLNWSPVSGAFAYTVQYKPASSGTWIFASSGTYSTFVNLYSLSAATTYDWRVYSNCSLTEVSGYSYGQFTSSGGASKVAATATEAEVNVNPNFTISLFPNPAGDQLNVWVEGVYKKTDIKVYNLMGKLVMQQGSGNTLTQLNISKLSAGFYLVHVNDGKETKTARFVKN
jgi:hypothetical protein